VHGEFQIPWHFEDFASLLRWGPCRSGRPVFSMCWRRSPGSPSRGARAVVAESVLVKQQLLILNRSRKRSPNLRLAERLVAGVCTLLMRLNRPVRSAIVLKPSTLLRLHRNADTAEISPAVFIQGAEEAGPEGPRPEVIARSST
jgi:hypothetical protein